MFTHFVRTYGTNAFIIDNPIRSSYTKIMNDVGIAVITVPGDHPAVDGLQLDDQIEIYRANHHTAILLSPYQDWLGLYRGYTLRTTADGREVADLFAFHENEILSRAVVAYPAGNNGVTKFTGVTALSVMQAIINDNFAGDVISGSTPRTNQATTKVVLPFAPSVPGSTVSDYDVAYRNVLSVLQELAELDNSTFAVFKNSPSNTDWLIAIDGVTFAGDKRSTIIFETRRESVADLELDLRTIGEVTVAIVGGQGEGNSRTFVTRTSANRDINTNNYESFLDGRNLTTTAALEAYGDALIARTKARPTLRFRPVQLGGNTYGRSYEWGDVVTVRHRNVSYVQRIREVAVTYDGANGESISLGFENLT